MDGAFQWNAFQWSAFQLSSENADSVPGVPFTVYIERSKPQIRYVQRSNEIVMER